jgi:hypothetical protein
MSEGVKEKEIVFRMAQSLMNDTKSQVNGNMKAGTDVGPYARRYDFLKERIEALKIDRI